MNDIDKIDIFLKENINGEIFIMPVNSLGLKIFYDQISVLSTVAKDMIDITGSISAKMTNELTRLKYSFDQALVSLDQEGAITILQINKEEFENFQRIFEDSFRNKKIMKDIELGDIEYAYLNQINELLKKFIN